MKIFKPWGTLMARVLLTVAAILIVIQTESAVASDDCSSPAVRTTADVTVSDGSSYQTESYFHDFDMAAIRFIDENEQVFAVEGPWSWISQNGQAQLGSDFHKLFALGHQYHALLLYFDDLGQDSRQAEQLVFNGENYRGITSDYPYGGTMHLIEGKDPARPSGILFEFPDAPRIESRFSDWRDSHGATVPYHIQVDDGDRVFSYRYADIELMPQPPEWFFQAVKAPELGEIKIYREQRKETAASCESPTTHRSGRPTPLTKQFD